MIRGWQLLVPLCVSVAAAEADDPWLAYRVEAGARPRDVVKLDDGTLRIGKALAWGDEMLVLDAGGIAARVDAVRVVEVLRRADPSASSRPALPDLTMAYVERVPAAPKPGEQVSLNIHIRNAGGAPSKPFECRVTIDDRQVASVKMGEMLAPGRETVLTAQATWPEGQHALTIEVDPAAANSEIARWNNRRMEATRSTGLSFQVAAGVIEAYEKSGGVLDTFSFHDWLAHHVNQINGIFENARFPSCPLGVLERVHIQRVAVGDVAAAPNALTIAATPMDERDESLLLEMLRHLGITPPADYASPLNACLVRDAAGAFVQRMHGEFAGGRCVSRLLSEPAAAYLNRTLGQTRARGAQQFDLPRICVLDIRGNDGRALSGVQVELYQRQADGPLAGYITDDKVAVGNSDAEGRFELPNRESPPHPANPFGALDAAGRSGLMLARLSHGGAEEFHFLSVEAFNVAALRRPNQTYAHVIRTNFSGTGAPARLTMTKFYFFDALTPPGSVSFRWPHWSHSGPTDVLEYRVFERRGLAGDDESPWTPVRIVPPNPPGEPAQPHALVAKLEEQSPASQPSVRDVWYSVAAVAKDGRQAALSEPRCIPRARQPLRMAIDTDMHAFIPVGDDEQSPMLHWTLRDGVQQFGLRVIRPDFAGYHPAAAGAALDALRVLVVADDRNHRIAWYERGELTRLIGKQGDKPGEFNAPSDVAIDVQGRVYVADRLNHRVQVLDREGKPLHVVGKRGTLGTEFNEPLAVCVAGNRLTVTDAGNHRVQVFDITGDKPDYLYSVTDLRDPDRAVCTPTGYVLVCGLDEKGEGALIVYPPGASSPERVVKMTNQGAVRRPRGLCYDTSRHAAYFVNAFPIELRWVTAN